MFCPSCANNLRLLSFPDSQRLGVFLCGEAGGSGKSFQNSTKSICDACLNDLILKEVENPLRNLEEHLNYVVIELNIRPALQSIVGLPQITGLWANIRSSSGILGTKSLEGQKMDLLVHFSSNMIAGIEWCGPNHYHCQYMKTMGRDLHLIKERDYKKARNFCLQQQDPRGDSPSYQIAYVHSDAPRSRHCLPCHTEVLARGLFKEAWGFFTEDQL